MFFLEKSHLANEFSVSKVDYDGNTVLSAKKLKISLFSLKSTMHLLKTLLL